MSEYRIQVYVLHGLSTWVLGSRVLKLVPAELSINLLKMGCCGDCLSPLHLRGRVREADAFGVVHTSVSIVRRSMKGRLRL